MPNFASLDLQSQFEAAKNRHSELLPLSPEKVSDLVFSLRVVVDTVVVNDRAEVQKLLNRLEAFDEDYSLPTETRNELVKALALLRHSHVVVGTLAELREIFTSLLDVKESGTLEEKQAVVQRLTDLDDPQSFGGLQEAVKDAIRLLTSNTHE